MILPLKIRRKLNSVPIVLIFSVLFFLISIKIPEFFIGEGFFEKQLTLIQLSWVVLGALLGMVVAPIFFIKHILREEVSWYGWRLPDNWKKGAFLVFVSLLILMPFILIFSGIEGFREYYSSTEGFLRESFFLMAIMSMIYFFSEEFLFRGFLFFGLMKRVGLHSFWISSLLFMVLHIPKPLPEVFFSFFAGLIFCYLSFKTKSFVPAAISHFVIAFLMNLLFTVSIF